MVVGSTVSASHGSRRERLRAMMHDDILSATRHIVQEQGFKELSMRALARAVGVTAPTLYDYFESKEAVLDALYLEGVRLLRRDFDTATADLPAGVPRLDAIAHAYRAFANENPDLFMLVFGRVDASYRPGEIEHEAGMSLMEPVIAAVLEAIEAGDIRPCDPSVAGRFLWTTVHGFVMLEVNQVLDKCPPEQLDLMFEQTLEMLRSGLRNPA